MASALGGVPSTLSHDRLQPAEPYWYHGLPADDPACVFVYDCEQLRTRGHDDASSWFELFEQRCRHLIRGGGNHDLSVWGVSGQPRDPSPIRMPTLV